MTKLFTAPDGTRIGLMKGLLEVNGIACVLRNDLLYIGRGELAPAAIWPEIWILDDSQAPKAQDILQQWQNPGESADAPWTCPRCDETSEGQFGACWNCGQEKP